MRTLLLRSCLALLAFGAPAVAAPQDADHAAAHGEAHGGEHGDPTHEAHPAGEHHYFTHDDDHDGVPNWRDTDSEASVYVVDDLAFHAFNLALLLGVLIWATRRPIADFVRSRALGLRKELTENAALRDNAKERYDNVLARLDRIESEVERIEADAASDAEREHAKLIERAHAEARRIGETAERNIRDEVVRARTRLHRDAVGLAVKLAESTLREAVSREDQQRLARQFLESLREGGPDHV